jgi:hypothetical protein
LFAGWRTLEQKSCCTITDNDILIFNTSLCQF